MVSVHIFPALKYTCQLPPRVASASKPPPSRPCLLMRRQITGCKQSASAYTCIMHGSFSRLYRLASRNSQDSMLARCESHGVELPTLTAQACSSPAKERLKVMASRPAAGSRGNNLVRVDAGGLSFREKNRRGYQAQRT